MKNILGYFKQSLLFTFITLCVGFGYGFYLNGLDGALLTSVIIIALGIIEISLSFDNAIANAKVLETMDSVWQERFLTWGMLIAVFGMRVLFPIIIVAFAGNTSLIQAANIAFTDHKLYQEIMESSHIVIAGFGGSFLLLVALNFFFDNERDVHWVGILEKKLQKFGRLASAEIMITLIILSIFSHFLNSNEAIQLLSSGIFGIIAHELVGSIGNFTGDETTGNTIKKVGLSSFIYLEVLDASFSFDGVIGAFAITNDIIIIAIGLSVGAMFVRSLTLMLVERKTMSEYRFLEHGAFWSILALSFVMFIGISVEIPEWIIAGTAISLIGLSFYSSIKANKIELLEHI